jgi:MoaA/NifB/PqqE/SkfB family radical SAM enzyme
MSDLPMLVLPDSLNYIGAFLTMDCNLSCSYCINDPEQRGDRRGIFHNSRTLPASDWVRMLRRIPHKPDLPVTLQGGEPMWYAKGLGVGQIVQGVGRYFDLLTNFALQPEKFGESLGEHAWKLQRGRIEGRPFQSIRCSWHPAEHKRVWKGGIDELVRRCEALRAYGFSVSRDKENTDVCIYMVAHPDNEAPRINGNVYFETKPFLGVHEGRLYGEYAYAHSTDMLSRGIHAHTLECECRTSELLVDPLGYVFQCHAFLYEHWLGKKEFEPVGNLLDPAFTMDALQEFRHCNHYGACIPCDTKRKNNRFQDLHYAGKEHTSVEIRNISWPPGLP